MTSLFIIEIFEPVFELMYLHSFIATLEHYTGQMKQSRKDDKHQGRKLINPAGGYPANIHRISTLIGHKPDLDAHWPQTGGDLEEIRWKFLIFRPRKVLI